MVLLNHKIKQRESMHTSTAHTLLRESIIGVTFAFKEPFQIMQQPPKPRLRVKTLTADTS